METRPSDTRDLASIARERVQMGPTPDWITPVSYNSDFKAAVRSTVTHLLIEQQVHAEQRQTCTRMAVRLETMQAVQQYSQWRLEFEPQTQSVTLHSIKIRRGTVETEHATLARMQFLRREAGLEGCVIDGWITVLLLLEDVCPGDTLEWAYTITTRPRLLPDHVANFFSLPAGVQIGKYQFSVRHGDQRPVRWKSSSPKLEPTITREGGKVLCSWQGEDFASPEPEECTPGWQIDFPWIQISDCPDWQTVSRAVLKAWDEDPAGDSLAKLTEEVRSFSPDLLTQVNRAIEVVQDRFRYLSVNLELGGQIPASAESVIRRRYGDCKDLAFLLVRLLRALGVIARPVLVNTLWRKAITEMLPSPAVFNHAIVEFQIGNDRRWVDATLKSQGGGALNRRVPDFGLGLTIDAETLTLVPVPAASMPSGSYEVRESFILGTAGDPSYYSVVVIAKGIDAEILRWEFENEGVEAIAKKRIQLCANRFSRAGRVEPLRFRDDRELNEFVFAEVFEIDGFLKLDGSNEFYVFSIYSDVTAGLLACPSLNSRRTPFALPYPCDRMHIIEVDSAGLDALTIPLYQAGNEFFSFSRRAKGLPKYLRLTFTFRTLAESIPPHYLQSHRAQVEPVWQEGGIHLSLPTGYSRMRKRNDFGALPLPSRKPADGAQPLAHGESSRPPTVPTDPPRPTLVEPTPAVPRTVKPVEHSVVAEPAVSQRSEGQLRASPPRRTSEPHSYSRRRGTNRRCTMSLYAFFAALIGLTVCAIFSRKPGAESLLGLMFLAVMAAIICSLVLAILGLKEYARHPGRYSGGKTRATVALVMSILLGLLLVPGLIAGVQNVITQSKARRQMMTPGGELRFDEFKFTYRPPESPWAQADARLFGRGAVLAFGRPEEMFFMIVASPVEPGLPNPTQRVVEISKIIFQRDVTSFRLVTEGQIERNGVLGWQMESRASFQGRDYHFIHWMCAANGFGYQMVIWGPPELAPMIKEEADRMFANFQPDRE